MRIRRLELCGFKSFVDPTTLEFGAGVSGIVGPNGCGKSNLVDALRWVLGEQSAKRLRGDAMEDVIFNGTASGRGPAGMAEVSLLLDNEGPRPVKEPSEIWSQLADVPEIQVTRRYFRSGESEYLINNRPCRLKDVTELFLGTGVGSKAYAMVEQGRVDQLVNAKPEDIRLFIEDAAGTTLYRDRRLGAERKLERTRENLARVMDILQEIDRQISFYRRLAKKAEQYRLAIEELKKMELQLARRTYARLASEILAIDAERTHLRVSERELASTISASEQGRESTRERLAAAEAELQARQHRLFAIRTARERSQARLEMLEREEVDGADQLRRLAGEQAQTEIRLGEIRLEIDRRDVLLAELRARNEEGTSRLSSSVQSLETGDAEVRKLAEEVERAKTEIVECLRREAEFRNRIQSGERRREDRERRGEVLASEIESLERDAAVLVSESTTLGGVRGALEERIRGAASDLDAAAETLARLRAEKSRLETSHLATAAALAEAESRFSAAEEVERGYGRYHEGVQAVMRKHAERPNGILNLVAEVIDTPPEFEKAVAAVLGERLQHVIVRSPEDARDAVRDLKDAEAGRSNFVPLEPRRLPHQEMPRSVLREGHTGLLDVVRVQEGFGALAESLLGDAVLVDDLEHAIALWRKNGVHRTMVTPEGEVLHPDGVVSGGSSGPREELLLVRRREIRRLRGEVERLAAEAAGLDEARAASATELAAAERKTSALEESFRALTIERVTAGKDAERIGDRLESTRARLGRASDEVATLAAEMAALVEESRRLEREGTEAARARSGQEDGRRRLDADLAARRAAVESESKAATELKVSLAQAREKEEALREGLRQMAAQVRELEGRLGKLGEEATVLAARSADRREECRTLRRLVSQGSEDELAKERDFEESRAAAESLRRGIREAEDALAGARTELDRVREERSRADLTHAERSMARENTVAKIRERYQVEVAEVETEEGDTAALESRFEELRQKVDRFDRSQVGTEAMGELAEEEKRREFLATQKADLERSIADLQKTIANLNRMSRDRFAETFTAVNEKFQETFPKLFRGGRGRLVFTDEGNLLETGVDIQIQPPGMNLRTLSLLSGGQKALTAVSLIFSLFQCRPSPFCVLDEVDAPLDDANIDRFNEMVAEMSGASQFLLITHNQRTMEVADTLYGVTMEEPGVSKVVAVRFRSAA